MLDRVDNVFMSEFVAIRLNKQNASNLKVELGLQQLWRKHFIVVNAIIHQLDSHS